MTYGLNVNTWIVPLVIWLRAITCPFPRTYILPMLNKNISNILYPNVSMKKNSRPYAKYSSVRPNRDAKADIPRQDLLNMEIVGCLSYALQISLRIYLRSKFPIAVWFTLPSFLPNFGRFRQQTSLFLSRGQTPSIYSENISAK